MRVDAHLISGELDGGRLEVVVCQSREDLLHAPGSLCSALRTLRGIGVTLEQSNRANIDKLRGRHGEAFDVFKDANRDLNAEQSKLEDHFKSAAGNTLFDAEIPVVKNPELDKLASQLPDDDGTSKASRMEDVNAEIHAKGVAHMRKAQGDMAEMAERIAQEVQPVPKGGVRG